MEFRRVLFRSKLQNLQNISNKFLVMKELSSLKKKIEILFSIIIIVTLTAYQQNERSAVNRAATTRENSCPWQAAPSRGKRRPLRLHVCMPACPQL